MTTSVQLARDALEAIEGFWDDSKGYDSDVYYALAEGLKILLTENDESYLQKLYELLMVKYRKQRISEINVRLAYKIGGLHSPRRKKWAVGKLLELAPPLIERGFSNRKIAKHLVLTIGSSESTIRAILGELKGDERL